MPGNEGLNEAQKQAVTTTEGPLLVLAGAGAGKTRVIAHRICELIRRGIAPENILAVTFTNKASKEMQERVLNMLKSDSTLNLPEPIVRLPLVSTFHSLGVRILRHHSSLAGVPSRFIIYDRGDSIRAIKEAMQEVGVDPKRFEPRAVLGTISRAKGDAITGSEFASGANEYYQQVVARVWDRYEKSLTKNRALDFDDLLLHTLLMFRNNKELLERYQQKFQYLHVDEYQDTNVVQYEITKLLAGEKQNICVVGDIDQTIYSWRGANLDNLLRFEKTFPGTEVIRLEQNYRSTKNIIDASNSIISKNKKRLEKTVFTENDSGESIALAGCYDENEEAEFVAGSAQSLITSGEEPREIAVLYRANFQSRALEEAFLSYDIPYQVLGVRFFERREVKDILSFIRAALDPENVSDFTRIINVPPRGIGKVTLLKMLEGRESEMTPAMQKRVEEFRSMLRDVADAIETKPPSEVIKTILIKSGLSEHLRKGSEEDKERLENIRELVTLATRYDALPQEEGVMKLLEDAALASDQDELKENRNAVRLMTVHAAKGLEFDHVFITGLEEGLFPHEGFDAERDEEEERRLFYVALTRARKKVFLTFAAVRTIFGSRAASVPSSFLNDIDENLIEPVDMNKANKYDTSEDVISID